MFVHPGQLWSRPPHNGRMVKLIPQTLGRARVVAGSPAAAARQSAFLLEPKLPIAHGVTGVALPPGAANSRSGAEQKFSQPFVSQRRFKVAIRRGRENYTAHAVLR